MSRFGARRRLLVIWAVFVVLAAAIIALESRDDAGDVEARDTRLLLPVPLHDLGAVEIAHRGRVHRFERAAAGVWINHGVHTAATPHHTHAVDPRAAERIQRSLAAFGRARVERQFTIDDDGAAYGVVPPEMVILVYRPQQSQPLAQWAVGALAPDTVSRYVTLVGSRVVATIPSYQIDNLLELLQDADTPPHHHRPARRR